MATTGVKVKVLDRKAYSRSVSEVFGTRQAFVKVGVFGNEGETPHKSDDGAAQTLTLVALAKIHEFGLGVPQRSFVRAYVDANVDRIQRMLFVLMQGAIRNALRNGTPITDADRTRILSLVGIKMVGEMQERISAGISPALAESTLRKKTVGGKVGTTPLIETGQLRSSIGFAVSLDGKWGGQ